MAHKVSRKSVDASVGTVSLPRRPQVPKAPHIAILGGAPKSVQAAAADPQYMSGPPPQPGTGELSMLTKPEWYVYWALTQLDKVPHVDFEFGSSDKIQFNAGLSDVTQLDFRMIDGSKIAMEIQGIFWHYEQGSSKIQADNYRRSVIEQSGWVVVFLDEDRVLDDPLYLVREALKGNEHNFFTSGSSYFTVPAPTFGGNI